MSGGLVSFATVRKISLNFQTGSKTGFVPKMEIPIWFVEPERE